MADAPPDSSKRRRHSKACTRCRKRKIRCNFEYPTCGACSTAGAMCLGFDSLQGIEKPRSVVRHLEDQVARLEMDLAAVRGQSDSILDNIDAAVHTLTTRLATATVDPTGGGRKQDQAIPLVSKYFLSDSPLPITDTEALGSVEGIQEQVQSWRAMTISSIPRHVVDAMLRHYCETYRPQYPSIGEEDLYKARDRVYDNPQVVGYDAFVLYITLAISSNTLMHIDEKRAATTTYGLWEMAVVNLEQVGATNSWERLQAMQLLTHYGFLNPQHVNVSHSAAAASRLALQLGLHEELPISTPKKFDSTILNTRRRMFWNAWGIDAAAHSVRCQPFKWVRPEITAKFPDSESQAMPTHTAHMWSLREIECDATLGLYYPALAREASNDNVPFTIWYARMQTRLEEWYQTVRQSVNLSEKIEFHELLFQIQVLRLNRPSPSCPVQTKEMHKRAAKASITLIKEFSILDRLGKMFMLWHAAHCVIEAGVYLLLSVLIGIERSSNDRRQVGGEDVNIIIKYIKILPTLIWKIARRWHAIMPYASALETVSISVLENLQQWSDGQDPWNTDPDSLRERVAQLMLFSPASLQEQAPTIAGALTAHVSRDQPLDPAPSLVSEPYHAFELPNFQLPPTGDHAPPSAGLLSSQQTLDQGFPLPATPYPLDYDYLMTWDFSGINSEEIFAALLEGPQPEPLAME